MCFHVHCYVLLLMDFLVLSVFLIIVLSVCWLFEFFILYFFYFGNGASFILCQLLNGGFHCSWLCSHSSPAFL